MASTRSHSRTQAIDHRGNGYHRGNSGRNVVTASSSPIRRQSQLSNRNSRRSIGTQNRDHRGNSGRKVVLASGSQIRRQSKRQSAARQSVESTNVPPNVAVISLKNLPDDVTKEDISNYMSRFSPKRVQAVEQRKCGFQLLSSKK
ncbi:RRM domain-containing protein [Caenorhabditis elegans]|uniref:RRM domain-containing protein n=1 Tax=Caenorhabditis elegans TaxID=6239 RepID=Q9TZM7_CAEEL|nr:RRM domain-containing protein [Caenorhabditis elegans]CCD69671.1 RRM domain-containing protein [Caenorhabditis elegans]|eukprot:NP_509459.2 Uncharacterized protein CELE_H35N09.2 [Caenorhabditis elegans]